MRSLLGLVLSLAVLTPVAVHATEKTPVAVASKLPRRFDVRPPQGFRPSETALMLSDSLASYKDGTYKPHPLLYPRAADGRMVIAVHPELLSSKDRFDQAGLAHVLGFAKSYNFSIVAEDATPAQRASLAEALKPYGVDHLVVR